jgi:hypothetical protein
MILLMAMWFVTRASGANIWDGEAAPAGSGYANGPWWYNPYNWNGDYNGDSMGNDNNALPNTGSQAGAATEIDNGYNVPGDGVVFDPANDPNVSVDLANNIPPAPNLGPSFEFDIAKMYLANGTGALGSKLTIESGTLHSNNLVIISRSTAVTSTIVQTGGTFITDLQLEVADTSGATGIYEYHGGTLQVGNTTSGSVGLRLGGVAGGTGIFKDYNDGAAGAINTANFIDGYLGVGYAQFHFSNGGTRPVQIAGQLSIRNNGTAQIPYLDLVLDQAPAAAGGVAPNLSLFSLGSTGTYSGVGTNPKLFQVSPGGSMTLNDANANGFIDGGETVAARYGAEQYFWNASYTGTTTFSNPATSAISSIVDNGTGKDVVLIGTGNSIYNPLHGDLNFDGQVNAKDIAELELALTDPNAYLAKYSQYASFGVTLAHLGDFEDVTGAGRTSNADLTSLLNYLIATGGGGTSTVPEPASFVLAGFGAVALGLFGWRRRKAA